MLRGVRAAFGGPPTTPGPILYAVDAASMKLLYRSAPGALLLGGKYATPIAAHGTIYVVTDRVHAFAAR